jgi:hypothetical protein
MIKKKRTIYTKNELYTRGDIGIMLLYDSKSNIIAKTIFDIEDFERIWRYKWGLTDSGIVVNRTLGALHSYLMDFKPTKKKIVMHKDGNKLNNRKNNLQICSTSYYFLNKRIAKNNKSGMKGIHWNKEKHRWCVQVCYDYKTQHIGYFKDKKKALIARKKFIRYMYDKKM